MIRVVFTLLALIWSCALAQAGFFSAGKTSAIGGCLYPATQSADGCAGAPVANTLTVQHPTFFTSYALQSSQTWPSTAGNTGPGNPGLQAPHPAYNVAGVDYPVGPAAGSSNPADSTYDRNLDATSPGYGLKLMTDKNYGLDGICAIVSNACVHNNGCWLSAGRINCQGTMPNNASCPTTPRGNNCVILDGYDFTNHGAGGTTSTTNDGTFLSFTTSLIASQVVIKNSYLAPSTLSYVQTTLYTFKSASTVTITNNKIDSKNDLVSLVDGTGWAALGHNNAANVFFGFSTTAPNTLTDNTGCGAYSIAYCIQYNAFVNSVGRMLSFTHADCITACDAFVSQFNYHEMGNNVQWKLTGWIDDGSNPGGYSGIVGKCFVVTSIDAGTSFTTATASASWQLLSGYKSGGGTAAFNTKANTYTPTTTACNNSASPIGVSFNMNLNAQVAVPPGSTFYMNNGIHGDPYFVAFSASSFSIPVPVIAGSWTNQYNVTLFPKDGWSSTGMSTQNTTNGPFIKTATLNNCTPNCATGSAGNTLNITSVTLNANLFSATTWPSLTFSASVPDVTLGTGNLPAGADVRLSCASLPTGFSASTDYFVVSPGAGTIRLAATAGGTAIQASSTGSSCRIQGNIYNGYLLPGSDNPTYTSPFPAGGVTVTGSALTGATCDNGACTGTGTNGTYLVSYAGGATTVSFSTAGSGMEMSGVSATSFNENHNVYIANLSPDFNANGLGPFAAVIGDNHAINYGSVNISNIFYDPSGGLLCMYQIYNNTPSPLTITNNVNLLGNGSNVYDSHSSDRNGCYGLAP